MDEDKFSFYMASYQTDEVQPSFFMPSERRETLKVILKRKHYREHAMGPREPTSKPIARVQTQYIRKQAQAKPTGHPKPNRLGPNPYQAIIANKPNPKEKNGSK